MNENLRPGDRVTWRSINVEPSGTVVELAPQGALVLTDGGRHILLSYEYRLVSISRKLYDAPRL